MQDAFRLVPNLTNLILVLYPSTPRSLPNRVTFLKLELFKADLPHGHLIRFLTTHALLWFINLRPCRKVAKVKKCMLASTNLSHLHDIHCPIECFATIIHLGFVRIRGDLTYESMSMSSVLHSFITPHFALYILSIHFWPDGMDVLVSIAVFAPMIRTLCLWEKPRCTVHCFFLCCLYLIFMLHLLRDLPPMQSALGRALNYGTICCSEWSTSNNLW